MIEVDHNAERFVTFLSEKPMALYTIGNFSSSSYMASRGQSFTPNVQGDGSGVPAGVNPVYLKTIMIAYPTSDTSSRQNVLYLYSAKPTMSDLNAGINYAAVSTSFTDEEGFGAGTYTRTFSFASFALDVATKYFALFSGNQSLRYATSNPYSGGEFFNGALGSTNNDAQFKVSVSDTQS